MTILPLFPTIMHIVEIPNFHSIQSDIVDYVYEQKDKFESVSGRTNMGGWQSEDNYHKFDNIINDVVTDNVKGHLIDKDILSKALETGNGPILTALRLSSLWINVNGKGNYNVQHNHPLSNFSGVFWIKSPVGSGDIKFRSPNTFSCYKEISFYTKAFKEQYNAYTSFNIPPQEGVMLIFPSFLLHSVEENLSDEDRISVAFNLDLGSVSELTEDTYVAFQN
jgi:uncharacterized protein (TIGR02466 family)|tara:strand:+ start:291 stop:956 length:666 start_codon:yes stop_codon:yes gene_type:complete